MKIVKASEMARVEKLAFSEGGSEDQFMNNAARGIAYHLQDYFNHNECDKKITVIAGKGNNAGDAYCAALPFLSQNIKVQSYQLFPLSECSPLAQKYSKAFVEKGGEIIEIKAATEMNLPKEGIILDGVLGTGFKGELPLFLSEVFEKINEAKVPIFSIDIPSGLEGDTGNVPSQAIVANYTIYLGLPKLGFFFNKGFDHCGKLLFVDFGLDKKFIDQAESEYQLLTDEVKGFLPRIKRSRHKYEAGYVVGVSGSKGMMGASVLAGLGALKSGAGIVKLVHLNEEFGGCHCNPELIHKTFRSDQINELLTFMEKASSLFIGPGIGTSNETEKFLETFLPKVNIPCVLDADALNIIAKKDLPYPKNTVITPHIGEAHRLLKQKPETQEQLLQACKQYAQKHQVIFVLKGGPTFILHHDGSIFINSTGDPGMATAGSGDVLTGVIASLIAQKIAVDKAAELGVFLHGYAGELAANQLTSYSMTAFDIAESLHFFFKK